MVRLYPVRCSNIKEGTMIKYFFAFATACVFLLSGCAPPPKKLSRDEWLKIRNHRYENTSPDEVLTAAEQIFKLADENDTQFSYNNYSLTAVRWAAPFPIHIWYHWKINTASSGADTDVNVSISTTSHSFAAPGGMTPHDFPDVIKLFYTRLDYLLNKSTTWHSCDDFKKLNPQSSSLEALCLLAKDRAPSSAVAKKHLTN